MLAADRPSSLPSRISYGSFSSPYGSGSWRAREIKRISRFKSFGFSTTEGEKRARRDQLLIQEGGHSSRDRYDLTVYTPVLQESWLLRMESYEWKATWKLRRVGYHLTNTDDRTTIPLYSRERGESVREYLAITDFRSTIIVYRLFTLTTIITLSDPVVVESVAQKQTYLLLLSAEKKKFWFTFPLNDNAIESR